MLGKSGINKFNKSFLVIMDQERETEEPPRFEWPKDRIDQLVLINTVLGVCKKDHLNGFNQLKQMVELLGDNDPLTLFNRTPEIIQALGHCFDKSPKDTHNTQLMNHSHAELEEAKGMVNALKENIFKVKGEKAKEDLNPHWVKELDSSVMWIHLNCEQNCVIAEPVLDLVCPGTKRRFEKHPDGVGNWGGHQTAG